MSDSNQLQQIPTSLLPTAAQVFTAVQNDDVEALKQIVEVFSESEEKLNILRSFRTQDLDSLPLLSFTIVSKARKCFYFLLDDFSSPSSREISSPFLLDEANWNTLTHAVESGNVEGVRAILDAVMNNRRNDENNSSLLASLVNQRTTEDWFPLTYAIVSGNVEIVKILLQVPGINLTSTVDDMTHKEIAEKRNFGDIVKMLEEKGCC